MPKHSKESVGLSPQSVGEVGQMLRLRAQASRRVLIAGAGSVLVAASSRAGAQTPGSPASAPATSSPAKPRPPAISAAFPYEPRYADVLGSRIHYVETGAGEPVLLLHGIPTSAYLWRNVMPFIAAPGRRVIAVDHIGFGRSDKPDITFSWLELARYLEAFVAALGLRGVTLVMHDLGGAVGLHYAWRNPANVRGFAWAEAALPPAYPRATYASFGPTEALFRRLRDPAEGRRMLLDENWWVETFLPTSSLRDLAPAELDAYRAPFRTPASRRPIFDMVQSLPIEGQPAAEWAAYAAMAQYWREAVQPKLMMYGTPGRVMPRTAADWAVQNLRDVETAWVGQGIHYLQEDSPEGVGRAVSEWMRRRIDG